MPNLEDMSADILRVSTPSMIQPIYDESYPAIADMLTTPMTSRFRLQLLFNVIRPVEVVVYVELTYYENL